MENKNCISESSSRQDERLPAAGTRRSFLKKIAYSAPVLVVLGQMTLPARVGAESHIAPPPFSNSQSGRPPEYQ